MTAGTIQWQHYTKPHTADTPIKTASIEELTAIAGLLCTETIEPG